MGHLYRQPIRQWRLQYMLDAVVETGTWRGDGVRTALDAGFRRVVTVDVETTPEATDMRLDQGLDDKVRWYIGMTSTTALPFMLENVCGLRVLWWLDAHLPERYGVRRGVMRTPLLREVELITGDERDHAGDVFVCDDTRLYGRPCADGPLPEGIVPACPDDLRAACRLLEDTHVLVFDTRDTGYLVALPK